MFKRIKTTRLDKSIKIVAELTDGLIATRIYLTSSYQEAFLKLEKEFRK